MEKWDMILKSGMGHNIAQFTSFNPYAVMLLPKDDQGIAAVKKLERAVIELKSMEMKSKNEDGLNFRYR